MNQGESRSVRVVAIDYESNLITADHTSFSVSIVEHVACLFRTLVKLKKQAGSMLYFSPRVRGDPPITEKLVSVS
jgi:hypothetical protein